MFKVMNTGFLRLIKFFKPNLKPLICLLSILASSIFVIEYCASKTFFVLFVFKEGPKDSFEVMIDLAYILLYELKKLIYPLLLKVKQQQLIEVIIISEFF